MQGLNLNLLTVKSLASKVLVGMIIAVAVIGVVAAALSLYFGGIRETNLQYCRVTQDRINAVAANRTMTREQKDKEIQSILANAVDELHQREFRCPEPFFQPEYNRP